MLAALVMSGEQARIPRTLQQLSLAAKDSFEVSLNMACAAILDGQLQEAERLLQLAETKGLEVLTEEDVSQVVCTALHRYQLCWLLFADMTNLCTSVFMAPFSSVGAGRYIVALSSTKSTVVCVVWVYKGVLCVSCTVCVRNASTCRRWTGS